MIAVSTSPFNLSALRKFNTWYSVADGNWSDPDIWIGNGKKKHSYPQKGDNVYIYNNVCLNGSSSLSLINVNNVVISAAGCLSWFQTITLSVNGDFQCLGTNDMTGKNGNAILHLSGVNNFINNFIGGTNGTILYGRLGNQPIMDLPYQNLAIYYEGSKYAVNNLFVNGSLTIASDNIRTAYLDLNNFDLNVSQTSSMSSLGTLRKTDGGNITFIGDVICDSYGGINVSDGNPTIEFRNGVTLNGDGSGTNMGTGAMRFTTNDQTYFYRGTLVPLNNPITIENITLTNGNTGSSAMLIANSITGTTPQSTFNNDGVLFIDTTSVIMPTGIFNYMHGAESTMGYIMAADYTLPYTSYVNIYIQGASVKTLNGDTTISSNLTISSLNRSTAFLDCGSYDLIIGGATALSNYGTLRKTGSGSIVFTGNLNCDSRGGFDWSGNPTVEFKNGATMNSDGSDANTGAGTVRFTTNNQTFNTRGSVVNWLNNNLDIENITLTVTSNSSAFTVSAINGTTATSILQNEGTIAIYAESEIMTTGSFDKSSFINTVIYNLSGDQEITAGTYSNLTLSGSGIKTLLGDVSVINTYTLNSPATLNTNGFTLTTP